MCQLSWSKSVATKESLLQSILEEFHCICKVHVEHVCMYWHALLICTIHIIDAYSSTTKENASSSIYIYKIHTQYGYSDILNTYAPWVCWYSIWLWHTIPRTITSWSTETLMCPCMFLICPYFAPHPPCMFLLCFLPFSCVSILYPPPCVPLVIFHVCPYSVLFECLYLMFPTLSVPISHPCVSLLLFHVCLYLFPLCVF